MKRLLIFGLFVFCTSNANSQVFTFPDPKSTNTQIRIGYGFEGYNYQNGSGSDYEGPNLVFGKDTIYHGVMRLHRSISLRLGTNHFSHYSTGIDLQAEYGLTFLTAGLSLSLNHARLYADTSNGAAGSDQFKQNYTAVIPNLSVTLMLPRTPLFLNFKKNFNLPFAFQKEDKNISRYLALVIGWRYRINTQP